MVVGVWELHQYGPGGVLGVFCLRDYVVQDVWVEAYHFEHSELQDEFCVCLYVGVVFVGVGQCRSEWGKEACGAIEFRAVEDVAQCSFIFFCA